MAKERCLHSASFSLKKIQPILWLISKPFDGARERWWLIDDIEILAKYLNLVARPPRAGRGVQSEDLACSRSGNLRILSVFFSSCSSPLGRHSGPWRKDGVSRGHLINFAFARID